MKKQLFNRDWIVTERKGKFEALTPRPVTLPYDAMLFTKRREDAPFASGNYALGKWEYSKHFFLPGEDAGKKLIFQFDGVYQNALVYINGVFAAHQNNGYTQFFVDATGLVQWGADNEIKVLVHLADGARWYSGAGIYRDVYMLTSSAVYVVPKGVRITTPAVDGDIAQVQISTTLRNQSGRASVTVWIETTIFDSEHRSVAARKEPFTIREGETAALQQTLWIQDPQVWDVDDPNLYMCHTRVMEQSGEMLDEDMETFGVRTLRLNPRDGLSVNGKAIKLQGCGIHHENGPIGAVSTDAVEERRIARLKAAGFNAIRTAHNPAGEALLRACDKLGMLVMHEAFDTWTVSKVDFDNTLNFQANWKDDLNAMVSVSYNHPSVIMYSIGNEIADTGSPSGGARGREIVTYLRSLDNSRYVINCINGLVSVMELLTNMAAESREKVQQDGQDAINGMMSGLGDHMKQIVTLDIVGRAIEESCSYLDIAGYNYMDSRYRMDTLAHPNRIICGTETFVPTIHENWKLVKAMPNVIGDFCWTGWDYCGEPGTGLVKHVVPPVSYDMGLPYPCLLSHVGEFSISGFRLPSSYYHEIVLGKRTTPYIAVQRPEHHDGLNISTPWSWSDSVSSWSWMGWEGKPVTIEVYSHAGEVELLCNGTCLGRQPAGEDHGFKAEFEAVYTPGELCAIAYADGIEQSRFVLKTATGRKILSASPEKETYCLGRNEMIYIPISATGENGEILVEEKALVQASWDGPVEFMGFGTDEPCPVENFMDHARTLYDGRGILVLRPTQTGTATIRLQAEGLGKTEIDIIINQ